MAYDLSNKVVLITGASSGIGRACAVEFHQAGARVAIAARSLDKLQALAAELEEPQASVTPASLRWNRILPIQLDVTDPASRDSALSAVRERFGPIDVLINNAGWAAFGTVARIPHEQVQQMLALNLAAPIALTQAVLPDMFARRHATTQPRAASAGQIINIASVVGFAPMPRMAVYSATKAALVEFGAALRQELRGLGIDVITIAPSSTATAFFDVAATTDAKATRLAQTQYTPQRVARAVLRASRNRRREVILSAEGTLICLIRRLSRRLADRIMAEVAKHGMPRSGL